MPSLNNQKRKNSKISSPPRKLRGGSSHSESVGVGGVFSKIDGLIDLEFPSDSDGENEHENAHEKGRYCIRSGDGKTAGKLNDNYDNMNADFVDFSSIEATAPAASSAVKNASIDRQDDFLLSLEESLEWTNRTSGMVTSFTLPMATSTGAEEEEEGQDLDIPENPGHSRLRPDNFLGHSRGKFDPAGSVEAKFVSPDVAQSRGDEYVEVSVENATQRIPQVTNSTNATIAPEPAQRHPITPTPIIIPKITRTTSRSSLTGLPATITTIESTIPSNQRHHQQREVQTPVVTVQIPSRSPSPPNYTNSLEMKFPSEGWSSPTIVDSPPSLDVADLSSNFSPGSNLSVSSGNRRRTRSNDIFRPPSRSSSPSPSPSSNPFSASNVSPSPNRSSPSRNHRKTFPLQQQHHQQNVNFIGHRSPYFHLMATSSTATTSSQPNHRKSHRKTRSYSGGEHLSPKVFDMIDLRHRPKRKTYNPDGYNNNILSSKSSGNSNNLRNSATSPPPLPPIETTMPRLSDARRPSSIDNTAREISFSSTTSATSSASSASTVLVSNNFHDMTNGSNTIIGQEGLLVAPPPPSTPAVSVSSGDGSHSPLAVDHLEERPTVPGKVVPSISVDFSEGIGNHDRFDNNSMECLDESSGEAFDALFNNSGSSLDSLGMHSCSAFDQNSKPNRDGHNNRNNGEIHFKTTPAESLPPSFPSTDDLSTSDQTSRVKNKKRASKVVLHRSSSTGSISSNTVVKYFKKNNLVILPTPTMNENSHYGYHQQRSKKYDIETTSSQPDHLHFQQQQQYTRHAKPTLQKSTLHPSLPPPHPLKHVQSDPQQLLTTVNSSSSNSSSNTHIHANGHHYYHNYWETDSTASTPKTSPARHRTCSSLSSVDIGESGILSVTVAELNAKLNAELENFCGESDGGYWYDGNDNSSHHREGGEPFKKDLVVEGFAGDGSNYDGFGALRKVGGVITADGTSVDDFSYSDDGTDSYVTDHMDQIGSGLDGRVSWVDNDDDDRDSKPMQSFSIPSFIQDSMQQHASSEARSNVDGGGTTTTTATTPVKVTDLSPPASPNPNLRNKGYSNSQWHIQQPSFFSIASAAHRSQNSIESLNSLSYSQASVGMPSIPSTPNTPYDGPLSPDSELFGLTTPPEPKNSSNSKDSNSIRGTKFPPLFKGDSFFEDERLFVQEIHNSGLQSNSFEHVEDSIPSNVLDLTEVDYDIGEDGVEVGIGKTHERREMERRMIQIYRQIRALGRKKKQQLEKDGDGDAAVGINTGNECVDENGMELAPLLGNEDGFSSATPRTSNGSGNGYFESSIETKHLPEDNASCWSDLVSLRMHWLHLLWRWEYQPVSNQTSNSSTHIELTSLRPSEEYSDEDDECRQITSPQSVFQSLPSSPFSLLASNSLSSFNPKHKLKHSNVEDYDYNSRGYDDIDFDRPRNTIPSMCKRILCVIFGCGGAAGCPCNLQSCLWFFQTRRKLLYVSFLFLIFAWVYSGGRLTKHHSGDENDETRYYYGYGLLGTDPESSNFYGFFPSDDALGRNNFVDDDGYFEHNPMMSPEDDDFDGFFTSSTYSKRERQREHISLLNTIVPDGSAGHVIKESATQDMNLKNVGSVGIDGIIPTDDFFESYKPIQIQDAVGSGGNNQFIALNHIDTIVVVGERHSGLLWLVDKLKQLYPDLAVFNGLPKDGKVVRDGWWFQDFDESERRRSMSATKDISSSNAQFLPFRRRIEESESYSSSPHIESQNNDSSTPDPAHILVIAVFLNPYDYVELMRVDPFNAPRHVGLEWKEFVEAEWTPFYGIDNSPDVWEDDDDDYFEPLNPDRNANDDFDEDSLNVLAGTDDEGDDDDWDEVVTDKGTTEVRYHRNLLSAWRILYKWMGYGKSSDEEQSGCQLSFGPSRVLPCWHTNDGKTASSSAAIVELEKHIPVYETRLDGSGAPYDSILQLRADKIRSAINDSKKHTEVGFVIPVKYETLVDGYSDGTFTNFPGIVGLMNRIESLTGMLPDKDAGWTEMSKSENKFWADPVGCRGHVCFPSVNAMRKNAEYIQYMNDHVDWEAESLVGYQKWPLPKPSVDQIVILGERHSGAEWLVEKLSLCFPSIQVS